MAAMQSLNINGYTANFAVTGNCAGNYAEVHSPATADTSFQGLSTGSAVTYASSNVERTSTCPTAIESSSWIDYFNGDVQGVGRVNDNGSGSIVLAAQALPSSAKVGDSGTLMTLQRYGNMTDANTLNGHSLISYNLEANTAGTAKLKITTKTYSDNPNLNILKTTEVRSYRVAADNSLSLLSIDLQNALDDPAHLVMTPHDAPSTCSATGMEASAASPAPNNTVCMLTDLGEIVLELYPDKAPKTVANFLAYVDAGFYNNTVFHRLLKNFVVQAGGYSFNAGYKYKTPLFDPIDLEAAGANGLSNVRGTIAMARDPDVAKSATSQFFINSESNADTLDPVGYAVFGRVISGIEVVSALQSVPVKSNGATKPEISLPRLPPRILWVAKPK